MTNTQFEAFLAELKAIRTVLERNSPPAAADASKVPVPPARDGAPAAKPGN